MRNSHSVPRPRRAFAFSFSFSSAVRCSMALALVLAGCSGGEGDREALPEPSLGRQASAVQGGIKDTDAAHNFAVGIGNRNAGVCTGTLIAPNLVLTARHCVVPADGSPAVTCSDTFGKNVQASQLFVTTEPDLFRARAFYVAKEILTPAEKGFCGNDIALVILEDTIPAAEAKPVTPAVQFSMTDRSRVGSAIAAMGYGITNPSAEDSGQRRLRENIGILCVPGDRSYDCAQLAGVVDDTKEFVTEGWVCSGDSGGGAFEQKSFSAGTPVVLGALSRGPQSESRCLAAIYTRTDAHADLIVRAGIRAAELGGYEPPTWTNPKAEPSDAEPELGTVCEGDICTDTSATTPPEPKTVTTQTSGCATAPIRAQQGGSVAALLALAGALATSRRRRSAS